MAEMLFPLQIYRQQQSSLDSSEIHNTLDGLITYALTSPIAYIGQILYCKENDKHYRIKPDKSIEEIGSGSGGSGVESTYTDTVGSNTTLGGWSPGDKADNMTLQEFANKLLHVYIPPTVVCTTTPSDTLFEKGTSVPSITLSAVVTKNSNTISKIEFLQNDAVIKTISTGVSDGGTFTNTISTPITTDKKYSVRITDTSGKEAVVKDINISFIPASYYGILNDETPDALDETKIKELNTVLKLDVDYTYKSIVMTNQRVCYATPTQYGDVKVIKDSNGFDITSAFTFSTMTINDQPYTVITLTNTGTYPTANPGTIIFSK